MKIVAISDTHGQHRQITLPDGDVIIHAGDMTRQGTEEQVVDFLDWFSGLPFPFKIFVAGNHDFFFEKESPEKIQSLLPENVIYLNDSGIEINGIKIWGSPIQPWFHDWAFNRQRGEDIRRHWDLIPENTDLLITHGPVAGILDRTVYGLPVGCDDLLECVQAIKPRFHICGHIHEAYGTVDAGGTRFMNASILNEDYIICNPPMIFEIP
ncbi:MAG TPA: metallophosphoesterase family protein [Bacteroidia bacterium]|nr:metallophosphoesterase family protein [Bacteroidia bacterium]